MNKEKIKTKNRFSLGRRSRKNLIGLNPVLAFFVAMTIRRTQMDFTVFEGVRLKKLQVAYVERGTSWTLNSNHLDGNAVDLVVWFKGRAYWDNIKDMQDIDGAYGGIERAAKSVIHDYNLPIQWGYDLWGKDKPHWQVTPGFKAGWDVRDHFSQDALESFLDLKS